MIIVTSNFFLFTQLNQQPPGAKYCAHFHLYIRDTNYHVIVIAHVHCDYLRGTQPLVYMVPIVHPIGLCLKCTKYNIVKLCNCFKRIIITHECRMRSTSMHLEFVEEGWTVHVIICIQNNKTYSNTNNYIVYVKYRFSVLKILVTVE